MRSRIINTICAKALLFGTIILSFLSSCSQPLSDGEHKLDIYFTSDIHGRYFDSLYVGENTKTSLLAVSEAIKEIRAEKGAENVILLDAGDCLQGDNASYYFNYVETGRKHIYARMAEYMGYDAVCVGNHDVETGHAVYDRINKTMKIPFLGGNAIREDNGKRYFDNCVILNRGGLKVAVLGYSNAAIKTWLSPEIWSGMRFESLMDCIQADVDAVKAKSKPQVVIVAVHSGTGPGDGSSLESQGRDLLYSLEGVDFLLCAHDHRPYVEQNDDLWMIDSGSHCRNLGHGEITVTVKDGQVVSKSASADVIPVDKNKIDKDMAEVFRSDYEEVKAFTLKEVGELGVDLCSRHSFVGKSPYINLIHAVCLENSEAQISFAAPLGQNNVVKAGKLIYNDLFAIYPFENLMYVVRMSGKEIKDCLEYSYGKWVNTVSSSDETLLNISKHPDPRYGNDRWSFNAASYNFDSAAGINYTVDVTKAAGERVQIASLADGTPFSEDAEYLVAMTSYRASGGGAILREGAGIDTDHIDDRVVARYPEIRNMLYDYLSKHALLTSEDLSAACRGDWCFVPEEIATSALERDLKRLFPKAE